MAKNGNRYPEGGWGWFVVLACFVNEFIVFGTLKAFGILLTAMKCDFHTDLWILGSIGTLHFSVHFILSPAVALIARKYGGRPVIMCGGVLYGVGLVLGSLTSSVTVLALSLVFLAGSGAACVSQGARGELAFYFHDRYPLAIFLALTGDAIGVMIYGPMAGVFMEAYGWRGAMLLLGGLGFNLVWAGALARRPRIEYKVVLRECTPTDTDEDSGEARADKIAESSCRQSWLEAFGLDIFFDGEFLRLTGMKMFYNLCFGGLVVYMVPNAVALGLSQREASLLTTAFGLGSLLGLLLGAVAAGLGSLHAAVAVVGSATALLLAQEPVVPTNFPAQMAVTVGLGTGLLFVMESVSVLARRLPFADETFVVVTGWMSFFTGIGASIGDVLSGWIYDTTESFLGTFLLFSATMVAIVLLSALALIHKPNVQRS